MVISVTVTITSKILKKFRCGHSLANFEVMVTVTEIAKGAFNEQ
jgi:hypothetical protein